MEIFTPYNFKKVYLDEAIFDDDTQEIKAGYINTNGIFSSHSISYLNRNSNLLNLDLLAVADTRLTIQDEVTDVELGNLLSRWNILCRFDSIDNIKHMGMIILHSKTSKFPMDSFTTDKSAPPSKPPLIA